MFYSTCYSMLPSNLILRSVLLWHMQQLCDTCVELLWSLADLFGQWLSHVQHFLAPSSLVLDLLTYSPVMWSQLAATEFMQADNSRPTTTRSATLSATNNKKINVKEFWRDAASHGEDLSRWRKFNMTLARREPCRCSAVIVIDWFFLLPETIEYWFPCFYMGLTTPNIVPFPYEIWTLSNTWFLGPLKSAPLNGISIASAVFAGLTNVTNRQTQPHRQTDHATLSAAIVCYCWLLLWCGLKIHT